MGTACSSKRSRSVERLRERRALRSCSGLGLGPGLSLGFGFGSGLGFGFGFRLWWARLLGLCGGRWLASLGRRGRGGGGGLAQQGRGG